MIAHCDPHQVGKEVSKGINSGRIEFADKQLSNLTYGYYSLQNLFLSLPFTATQALRLAIVEATAVT
ncbi:hypothetical protein K435DRAFT_518829 [Dendrothele bispora CBS 962.96]|uniref:Uncharacterized protein n=1 Tax=Dendrothele bispora (strain CBS 962.96) TaxID=1314807 RepID=A0A4S8M8Z5_DENBC|nr:hypothetical protein K435DRAFT_518829 [Dendrothele bispora CBS 962.96]